MENNFSTNEPVIDGAMQDVHDQTYRINELCRLGGPVDWQNYGEKEKATGIPAIYFAKNNARPNLNRVEVKPGTMTPKIAKVIEALPDYEAVPLALDPAVMKKIEQDVTNQEFYDAVLAAQSPNGHKGGGFQTAVLKKAATENPGQYQQRLASILKSVNGMDDAEAQAQSRILLQVFSHKPTDGEQALLKGIFLDMREGKSVEEIVSDPEYGKNPYLRRMAELYADHQRKAAIGALMLAKQIYGADEWKGFSSDQKKTALATMENRYPGFEWLSDVPVDLVDNIGAFDNIGQKVASAANFFGAVDLGTAIIKRMNPYDDADPRLLSSGQLHANRAYQREILNALRPSTWGDKIISATAATIPFVYEMGMSGVALGTKGVIKNLPRLLADPKGYLAGTAKLFGLNALHGIKSPAFIAKNIIQAAADTIENESTQPVVVFDPESGTNLVVNDADAENLFGKFAGAFGKHMISNSISVGVEGLGEAFDVALPLGAKKYVLSRIFGNASPKVLARFSDGLRRFGIQSFPAELIEEMVEDPLQASKDWLLENTGLDVLSTHQESQLLHDPVEFFKTTPVVLAAMRLPANVSAVMASIGDYNRAKIAAAMVDGRITDYPGNLSPDVGDKDQNPISGQAQKTWGQVRNLFVCTPKCATDRIMETADPKIAEQVKTIIHEDDAGMQAISTNEAREFVRNHPETKQLVLDVLHCGVQSSFYEHTLTPEDIKNALNVTAERADVLANIATTVRDAVEQMPDSPERRKATASSNLAFVQLVTSYSNVLLGRDFDALPPDAKKARTDEVMKAVSGMTIAAVNSNDLGTPVEDIKGVTVADVYANSSAARNAVIAFSNATGMDMSPSIYRAAEAALSFIEEKGNSEDSELALYNSIADMLERQLSDGQTLTIGDTQIRIREIKGDEADSPSQFQCEIASKGLPIERLEPADTYDKALEEAANSPSVRDRIANKLIDATDETKKLKGALSTTAYGALHGDAATLANGDNITIRNADNIISLRAMKPTYRALLRAYLMRQAGASPEEVYQKTMWIGSAYGHWQFAVPPVLLSDATIEQLATGNGQVRLSDIVPEDSPLLNLHPELANMMVPVFSGDVLAEQNAVPLEESTIKAKAMAAMDGDANAKAELNGIVYSSIADVIETREGLDDGTVPRVAPDLAELNKYVLADVKEGTQIGNRNSTEIDRQLIRAFDIPAEFQKTPAEYVLRLANERGGIDALLNNDFELTEARPPRLKGLTTFSEKGGLMNDYSTLIMLFKGADTSTMVHETGHWMYRVLKQFAKSGVASRDLLDAVAAIDAHLAGYARSKGAIEGTNEWESRCHEAFAEVFVKYLLTADAPPLIDGALSQVRKQLQNTYRYLKANSDVSLSPEIDSFFGSMMAVEDMFNNGEAPLSALMDAGALRQFLMDNSGALDVSSAEIEKLCQLLDVARDSQVAVAGREARDSIDEGALDAEANEAYDLSLHPKIDKALASIGGVPFDAVMDALPDEIDGIPKGEIRRKLYQIAHKHGWIYVPHEAHERMRGVREEYAGDKLAEESLRREHESLAKAVEAAETTLQATEGKLAQMVGNRAEKVEVAKTDVAILQGQEKTLHRRYDEAYARQVQAANMQDAAEKKMATVRGQSKQLRDELGEKVKEAQVGVNDARKELSNAESSLTATQRRLNIVQRRVDNLRTRLDAAKEKYKGLIDKSQLARVEDREAVAVVAEERDFYDAAIKELHDNVAEQARLDRRLQTLNKKHIELVERLGGAQARQAGFDKKLQIRRQIVEKVKSGKHELRDVERAERGIELEAKRASVSSQQLFEVEKEIDEATKRLEHLIDTFGELPQNLIGSDASLKRAELTRGRKREAVEKLSDRKRMAHAYVIALRDALAEAKDQLKWTRQSLAWVQPGEQKANGDWDGARAVNRHDNARARVAQAKKNLEKAIQKRDEMRAVRNAPETYARFNDELATLSREQASAAIMHGEAKREADETQRERKRNRDKVMQLQKQIVRMEAEIAEAKNKYGAAMDMAKLMLSEAISRRDDVFARLLKQEAETKQLRNGISGHVPAAEREGVDVRARRNTMATDDAIIPVQTVDTSAYKGTSNNASGTTMHHLRISEAEEELEKRMGAAGTRGGTVILLKNKQTGMVAELGQKEAREMRHAYKRENSPSTTSNAPAYVYAAAMVNIDKLFASSALVLSHDDRYNVMPDGSVYDASPTRQIHRFLVIMGYEGGNYAVKITAKEFKNGGNTVYGIQTMTIKKASATAVEATTEGVRRATSNEMPPPIETFGNIKKIFDFPKGYSLYAKISVAGDSVTQQSEDASVDFKNSPLAEQFREEESAKQLSKIEEAMRNNDFPVTSLTSLARAIAQFASRHQYVTDYKNRLRQEILENPDMSLRMKTLDSDRLNEVFDRFTMLFKTFAPMYTRSQRRGLNVASAQARIDNSTVKAIMHNKVDAGGENGEIRLYDGIRSEAKNIMFALTEVAKHFGELRKDGKMTAIALRKAAQASGALDSINRLIQEVAIAKRLNHAQGIISRFAKQLRISRINKMQGRIDGDALYALREIQQAVSGELTSIVPNTPNTPGNVGKNWRRLFVEQINAMVQECNGEPRQWEEFCYSDNIDIESLTVAQLQELSDFYSCIKHFGKMMVDKASQDSREHIEQTVNKIIEEITPDADKHNHRALPTQEEGGAPLWRRALDSAMTLDSMSKLLHRFMTEHGGTLAGLYNRLTGMRHDEDALKALCYDGQFGLNQTLKNIETMAMNQNIDVSALDNSEVAFRASNDPYSYRHWTVHEAIMATLYLGTDSGRQRLRRTILSDPKLTEQQIMEILPDEVLEQIPAALPAELLTEINSIWRILDNTINPSVRDTYRKQYGVDLELLPAVPFSVNGVQMSGGYIPLAYRYSAAAYKSFKGNGDYGKGTDIDLFERGKAYTPQTSSIHKRQQALPDPPPLSLNLNVIKHYTDESAHYATFALGMGYVLKVIRNKTFKNTYERAYGVHDYDAMEKTVLQISAPDKFLNPVNAFERTAKGVMVARALWGNLTSVTKQFASITIGAHEIGRGRLLGAMANWLAHPLEADRWARDMSPYLRDRAHHIDNDISNTINNLLESKTVKAWESAKWIGFAPMTYCDRVVASIGFKAAYDKALSEGETISEAVAYAEDFVKRTQGSAEAMYNPQLKNHPVGRACTAFMTAAIAAYNMARHDVAMSSKKGIKATLLSLLDDVLMPSIICAIITFLHTPGEEDESIMNKRLGAAATEFGQTVWGGVPGANLVLDTVQSMYTETGYGKISGLPWFEPYDEVARSASKAVSLAVGGQYTASALNLLNAVSIMGEVPVVKFGERMAKYSKAYGLTDPDEKPWTLREFTREAEKETR